MKCRLVMEDWRQVGKAESIYSTPLGVELSLGDMHSGTTFKAAVELPPDVAEEIENAWREHCAYPVLRLIPTQIGFVQIITNENEKLTKNTIPAGPACGGAATIWTARDKP